MFGSGWDRYRSEFPWLRVRRPVKNRGYACSSPFAQNPGKHTVEEVLNGRMVCDPLRMLECCVMSVGSAVLLLAGCSAIPYEPADQPVPAEAEPPVPARVEPPPVAPPPPPAASTDASRSESEPSSVAVLVSDSIPAYNGIAAALTEVGGERRIAVFDLDGDPA